MERSKQPSFRPALVLSGAMALVFNIVGADTSAGAGAGAGNVTGTVSYQGPAPKRYVLQMKADPHCEAIHGSNKVYSDLVLVGEGGGLQNAFVYVQDPPAGEYEASGEPARLEQEGCLYRPHVQGIRVDQTLDIVNADATLHNVRALAKKNRAFNLGQPDKGTRQKTFSRAEPAIQFKCDVHPWMTAYVFVMEHPFYAVTDAQGSFTIPELPAGEHTLVVWHEAYGEQTKTIKVEESGSTDADFTFTGEGSDG